MLALSVIDFDPRELSFIANLIINGPKSISFDDKLALFNKILTKITAPDTLFIYVMQGNNTYQAKPIHKITDNIFCIYVRCLHFDKGTSKDCYKLGMKNESDDVTALVLYKLYIEDIITGGFGTPKIIFWTYDNYDWYKYQGGKFPCPIILNYFKYQQTDTIYLEIDEKIELERKNADYQFHMINFVDNPRTPLLVQNNNHLRICYNIIKRYYKGVFGLPREIPDIIYNFENDILINLFTDYKHQIDPRLPYRFLPIWDIGLIEKTIEADLKKHEEDAMGDIDGEVYLENPDGMTDGGGIKSFKKKYLKYKNKYLQLKNKCL
jgi:hypothetical protein